MRRRDFLRTAGGTVAAAPLWVRRSDAGENAPPNILWLTCEDISPHLGCFGQPGATTLNLDRLASEGVRYINAFSVSGVCAPSRSCLITGMYPNTLSTQHMRCNTPLPPKIQCFSEYLREAGYYCTNNAKTDYQFDAPASAWDESSKEAHWRNRPDPDQPFFAVFNQTITHESNIGTLFENDEVLRKRLEPQTPHAPDRLDVPPYFPDTPVIRRHWAHYFDLITMMDHWVGALLQQLEEDGLADNTLVFFFSDNGAGLPCCKRWLYDRGIHVPLIVRWPGKLPPGIERDELVSFVDFAPTVLSCAGLPIPAYMQGRAFLGSATSPTRNYVFAARDRMDERCDLIRAIRDKRFKYIRNYEPYRRYDQHLVYPESFPVLQEMRRVEKDGALEGAQKLFFADAKPLEELYDLHADPHEIHNIVDQAEFAHELGRLREALDVFLDDSADTGFIPELDQSAWLAGTRADPPETLPVYELVSNEAVFGKPVKVYVELLNGSNRLRRLRAIKTLGLVPDALPLLRQALDDYEPAVVYWAAVSLGHLGDDTPEGRLKLLKVLKGKELSARLGAARGLVLCGCLDDAVPALLQMLSDENEYARLSAVETLELAGLEHPGVRDAFKRVMQEKETYPRRIAAAALGIMMR